MGSIGTIMKLGKVRRLDRKSKPLRRWTEMINVGEVARLSQHGRKVHHEHGRRESDEVGKHREDHSGIVSVMWHSELTTLRGVSRSGRPRMI